MLTQKQEQKIKTIDLTQFLDSYQNNSQSPNPKDNHIKSRPCTIKLKNYPNSRAQTCFSIQTYQPHTRYTNQNDQINPNPYHHLHNPQLQNDLQKINVDQFIHAIMARDQMKENQKTQHFIRSLNGTWFHDTNQNFKCSKVFNTLGIKKNRSSQRPKTQRYNSQHQNDKINFNRQFRQTGIFPSRKTNSYRKKMGKSSSNIQHLKNGSRNNEGLLKYQIVKTIKNEIENNNSPKVVRKHCPTLIHHLKEQKFSNRMSRESVVKGTKMVLYQ